jgi:hypothetical protein
MKPKVNKRRSETGHRCLLSSKDLRDITNQLQHVGLQVFWFKENNYKRY